MKTRRYYVCEHGELLGDVPPEYTNVDIFEALEEFRTDEDDCDVSVVVFYGREVEGSFYIEEDGSYVWQGSKVDGG